MDDKDYLNNSLLITLKTLESDFGVDVSEARELRGDALKAWVEAAEDAVFARQIAERNAMTLSCGVESAIAALHQLPEEELRAMFDIPSAPIERPGRSG
jgi:hypothetical protein